MDSQLDLLRELKKQGEGFTSANFCFPHPDGDYGGRDTPEWTTWLTRVSNLVDRHFNPVSSVQKVLVQGLQIATDGNDLREFNHKKALLLKAIDMAIEVVQNDAFGELKKPSATSPTAVLSTRIFIVHGHDHELKAELESLLRQFGLDPVVLHRQPDAGRTVIEKFEEHADVGYAFVLLTPDDIAYTADQDTLPEATRRKEFRARPNVLFEHGYFVGKLGRSRVCCLYKGHVTLPSDVAGLLYKNVDAGLESQAYAIIKELRAAGYKLSIQ